MRKCEVEGCERKHAAKGFCHTHYNRSKRVRKCRGHGCLEEEYQGHLCKPCWEQREEERSTAPPTPIFDFPEWEYLPWMELGLCLDTELLAYAAKQIGFTGLLEDLFHPLQGKKTVARAAKAICDQCPVKQECAQYAIEKTDLHGIWGGLTGRERSDIRNARKREEGAA